MITQFYIQLLKKRHFLLIRSRIKNNQWKKGPQKERKERSAQRKRQEGIRDKENKSKETKDESIKKIKNTYMRGRKKNQREMKGKDVPVLNQAPRHEDASCA
jgi:hypothetical protein